MSTNKINCKRNQILRRGYTRREYYRKKGKKTTKVRSSIIAPGCITKRSRKQNLIILNNDDHFLSEYGYHNVENTPMDERHIALHKLIEHFIPIKGKHATYNYIIKALNARYILSRNTNPKVARIFKRDQRVISREYKNIKNMEKKTNSRK